MKNNTFILIITSIICLSPIILALTVYNDLPENMAMQWSLDGTPNWYAPKAAAIFGIPVFFTVLNILVLILLKNDPRKRNISSKMSVFVQWLIPIISLVIVPIILFMNMGINLPIIFIVFTLLGVIFIFIGNYLPKCKQNYLVGFRFSWTLNDSENWNKTHRIGGYFMMLGGVMFIIIAFLPFENHISLILLLSIMVLILMVPILYSYSLYKKSTQKEVL